MSLPPSSVLLSAHKCTHTCLHTHSHVSLSHHSFSMQISCFTNACNYDGGHDCYPNVDTSDPFRYCLEHDHCRDRYSNGYCDHECNNARCLYDGSDCVAPPSTCSHLYVASSFLFLSTSYLCLYTASPFLILIYWFSFFQGSLSFSDRQ